MRTLNKSQYREIIQMSIEVQQRLFKRLESETKQQSREWTACQIAYQKGIYKAAMHNMGGGFVVDGVKPASDEELVKYYEQLIEIRHSLDK